MGEGERGDSRQENASSSKTHSKRRGVVVRQKKERGVVKASMRRKLVRGGPEESKGYDTKFDGREKNPATCFQENITLARGRKRERLEQEGGGTKQQRGKRDREEEGGYSKKTRRKRVKRRENEAKGETTIIATDHRNCPPKAKKAPKRLRERQQREKKLWRKGLFEMGRERNQTKSPVGGGVQRLKKGDPHFT